MHSRAEYLDLLVLVGNEVIYENKGKTRTGYLSKVKFDEDNNTYIARIEKPGICINPFCRHEKVPLSKIVGERNHCPEITNSSASYTCQYNGIDFYKMNHDDFKIGEEVVWMLENRGNNPLIGKVVMIGSDGSQKAIVQFDEPTTHFPSYIADGVSRNRNIVDLKDILKLDEWLRINGVLQEGREEVRTPTTPKPTAPFLDENLMEINAFNWR